MGAQGFGLFDPAQEKDSCGVGSIADIKGRQSHKLVQDALTILLNLEHRGAVGADPRAGDGAGILVQTPHKFLAKKAAEIGFALPPPGHYAVGVLFLPHEEAWRQEIMDTYVAIAAQEGMTGSRLARRADRQFDARQIGQADRAGAQAGLPRAQPDDAFGAGFRAPALHPPQDHLLDALRPARAAPFPLLPGVDLVPHADLQGHVPRRSAQHLLSRICTIRTSRARSR